MINVTHNSKEVLLRIENDSGSVTITEKEFDILTSEQTQRRMVDKKKEMLTDRKKSLELELAQTTKELENI